MATTLLVHPKGVRRGRPRPPFLLVTGALVVALGLLLPLAFLSLEAAGEGWGQLTHLLFRQLTATLLWNTVRLSAAVTFCTAVVGTAAAWLVECTDLPARRLWAVLVVIPIGIP